MGRAGGEVLQSKCSQIQALTSDTKRSMEWLAPQLIRGKTAARSSAYRVGKQKMKRHTLRRLGKPQAAGKNSVPQPKKYTDNGWKQQPLLRAQGLGAHGSGKNDRSSLAFWKESMEHIPDALSHLRHPECSSTPHSHSLCSMKHIFTPQQHHHLFFSPSVFGGCGFAFPANQVKTSLVRESLILHLLNSHGGGHTTT